MIVKVDELIKIKRKRLPVKLIYVLVYFMPGSFDPVETGMRFDTLAECNDAAFEMAASFDMKYTLQCVPQDSGDSLPQVSFAEVYAPHQKYLLVNSSRYSRSDNVSDRSQ